MGLRLWLGVLGLGFRLLWNKGLGRTEKRPSFRETAINQPGALTVAGLSVGRIPCFGALAVLRVLQHIACRLLKPYEGLGFGVWGLGFRGLGV